jgi:NADH dehydrogenase FAD-containing subunit
LIDQRDYSEYTPGILRLFCQPNEFFQLAQPLPPSDENNHYQLLQGKVVSIGHDINHEKVLTYIPTSLSSTSTVPPQKLSYDHVILATGATYTSPISPTPQQLTLVDRYHGWKEAHQRLQKAKSVIILGGGAIGVELAAEIVDFSRDIKITLLDAQSTLVPMFPPSVGAYAQKWLETRGVTLKLGQSLSSWTRGCPAGKRNKSQVFALPIDSTPKYRSQGYVASRCRCRR